MSLIRKRIIELLELLYGCNIKIAIPNNRDLFNYINNIKLFKTKITKINFSDF